jgi:hypothetical protein
MISKRNCGKILYHWSKTNLKANWMSAQEKDEFIDIEY